MSITDEDVARMPGTRRSNSTKYVPSASSRGWTALSSRESLPKRPVETRSKHSQSTTSRVPVWPLPPRLTRSTGAPAAKAQISSQDRIKNYGKGHSPSVIPDFGLNALTPKTIAEGGVIVRRNDQEESPHSAAFAASALKPEPLFQSKQRSISAGILLQRPEGGTKHTENLERPKVPEIPEKPLLRRSASLCSQHAGMAPTRPIPPLPANFSTANKLQHLRTLTEASSSRASGNSLFSGDTSILDDCVSRALSQVETNLTSASDLEGDLVSSEPRRKGMTGIEKDGRLPAISDRSSYPLHPSKSSELLSKSEIRKSCRGSIVQSLPRSPSSGLSLSLSLAPDPSRNASCTSLHNEKGLPSRTPSLMVPKALEYNGNRRGKSPASPLRNATAFDSQEELKTNKKHMSTTLQVISGNEGSTETSQPESYQSFGENSIFLWDPVSPMQPGKPSASRDRAKGHLRQSDLKIKKSGDSTVRISDIPLAAGVPSISSPIKELSLETPEQKSFARGPSSLSSSQALPRPLARVTFDPQIVSKTYPKDDLGARRSNVDSPTLSIFRYNLGENSSAESLVSSPSPRRRTPVHHRQSGSNPNRSKPVFSIPGQGHWSIMKFDSTFSTDPTRPIVEQEEVKIPNFKSPVVSRQSSTVSTNSQAYSFMCPIPPEHDMPPRRTSPCRSPIRGPRAAPAPARRSPVRGIGKSSFSSSPHINSGSSISSRNLRKSVMALRRQNSEAQNSPLQEHRNYLDIVNPSECSLSGSERGSRSAGDIFFTTNTTDAEATQEGREQKNASQETIISRSRKPGMMRFEGAGDNHAEERERERGKSQWSRMLDITSDKSRPESPGTLYDSSGFLKE